MSNILPGIEVKIEKELKSKMSTGSYLIFIDGELLEEGGNFVLVRKDIIGGGSGLTFFTSQKQGSYNMEYIQPGSKERVILEATKTRFLGRDFSDWLSENYEPWMGSVVVNDRLKFIFIESPMYNIFRSTIVPSPHLQVRWAPRPNGSGPLSRAELGGMLNLFRLNGFMSLASLDKPTIVRKLDREISPFYRSNPEKFCLALWEIEELFNPLTEDVSLKETLANTQFMHLINEKRIQTKRSGMFYSYVSNNQLSKALGLKHVVPFYYSFLMKLICGLVVPAGLLPLSCPSPHLEVFRLREPDNYNKKLISVSEYLAADPDTRSLYLKTTSLKTYALVNRSAFERRNFRNRNLLIELFNNVEFAIKEEEFLGGNDSVSLTLV